MSRINGAGQPSVDEILASIRASIAEEEVQPATAPVRTESFRAQPAEPAGNDGHEFDLPNIFRPTLQATPEKHTKLFGRLADALLGANGETSSEMNGSRRIDLDAPRVSEPVPVKAAPQAEQPSTSPAPDATPEVQRVMAPFRDTRMSRLGGDGSSSSLGSPISTPSPSPAPVTATPAPAASEPLAKGQWTRPEPAQPSQSATPRGLGTGSETGEAGARHNGHGMNGASVNGARPMNGTHLNGAGDAFNGHAHVNGASSSWSPENAPSAPVPPAPPQQAAPQRPAAAAPDAQHDVARGGVEDAAAQLLRPMLRQWLSENMPKIVESALRSEAADAIAPGGKTPNRD